jgi:Xaa-Pro aminopeptidase
VLHDAVTRVIVEGLIDLRVLRGSIDRLLEKKAYQPYYPHQTSHWLGLDVHDPGDYSSDGNARVLEPGMVFTIEPGLYFRPAIAKGIAEHLSGIAIRIEDDVLVTEDGCEILSGGLPTSAAEIEELVGLSK